jgi:putative transposase
MPTLCLKYRIYPTPAQETRLRQTLETCRDVYNSLLHWREFAYETQGRAGEEPGCPRRKGQAYDSFTYPQLGFSIGEGFVHLSKIGQMKSILHRPVRGTVRTCTTKRAGSSRGSSHAILPNARAIVKRVVWKEPIREALR